MRDSALPRGDDWASLHGLNPKRLVLAIVAVFLAVWAMDMLIHRVWLASVYGATLGLWRPDKGIQGHMGWLMGGQFLAAVTFVVLWARGFAEKACIVCAVMFGHFMGLFHQATTHVTYAVQPMPGELMAKWFLARVGAVGVHRSGGVPRLQAEVGSERRGEVNETWAR